MLAKQNKNKIICIICPLACQIQIKNSKILGAKCKRGIIFSKQETKEPLRVLTSTIKYQKSPRTTKRIPIKTQNPVPLSEFGQIMDQIHQITLKKKPKLGSNLEITYINWLKKQKRINLVITGE